MKAKGKTSRTSRAVVVPKTGANVKKDSEKGLTGREQRNIEQHGKRGARKAASRPAQKR